MSATGMPLTFAIGTSLVVVATFGAATAASYAASGLIDWKIAALFILGGRVLSQRKRALGFLFASLVVTCWRLRDRTRHHRARVNPVSDKGEKQMMNDMMGIGMWGMGLVWLLVLIFLVLAVAALIKYIRR
jgi:hypothetical protein